MKLLLLFLLLAGFVSLNAQISRGGEPLLKPGELTTRLINEAVVMPSLPSEVMQDAAVKDYDKGQPLRFAHPNFVDLTPDNSGRWETRTDGTKIWRLVLKSEGAYSLNIIFDRFVLVPGTALYLFNPDQSMVFGAFTHENNLPTGILATAPIQGDIVILEYHVPPGTDKSSQILIGAVNHDYLNLYSLPIEGMRFNRSGDCNPDFTCENDENTLTVGRSVCRLIVDGTVLCSGTLINNTRNDGTPYVLSAAHCLGEPNSHETIIFTFNYEVPNCDNRVEGNFRQTVSGATLRAFAELLDVVLLEMSSVPPPAYRPYWSGWTRTVSPLAPVKSIHHPQGDVKKVAHSQAAPTAVTFASRSLSGKTFLTDSHWRIARWTSGTTEGGSSGAALFDANGRLIGSLSGGSAICGNPVEDFFARLNKAWNFYTEPEAQLAAWLDPIGSNAQITNGFDLYDNEIVRLSNFSRADSAGMKWLKPGQGVLSGHNSLQDKSMADYYGPFENITIHGIYLMPARSVVSSNQTVNIRIWQGVNKPDNVVFAKNNLTISQLPSNREYLLMLDEPISVIGNIWAEVELKYAASVDSFAIYQTVNNTSRLTNSAWVKSVQNDWMLLTEKSESSGNTSFWIDLLASNVQLLDTSIVIPPDNGFMAYPNPLAVGHELELLIPDAIGYATLELFTIAGQKALYREVAVYFGYGKTHISGVKPGLYLLRVVYNEKQYIQKLLIISG